MHNGKLIAFSGIDGSGKSSISQDLVRHYNKIFPCVSVSGFEKRIFTGELQKLAAKHHSQPHSFFSDYIYNIAWLADFSYSVLNNIVPLLDEGVTVFVDRYSLCAKVYSQATTKQDISTLFALYEALPTPDLCLYLSTDVHSAMMRINQRKKSKSYYENEEMLGKIKAEYEKRILAEPYPIKTIDASKPYAYVFNDCKTIIDTHFSLTEQTIYSTLI